MAQRHRERTPPPTQHSSGGALMNASPDPLPSLSTPWETRGSGRAHVCGTAGDEDRRLPLIPRVAVRDAREISAGRCLQSRSVCRPEGFPGSRQATREDVSRSGSQGAGREVSPPSTRSATLGTTGDARRAGGSPAISATTVSTATIPRNVDGSRGVTPNSRPPADRTSSHDAATPTTAERQVPQPLRAPPNEHRGEDGRVR